MKPKITSLELGDKRLMEHMQNAQDKYYNLHVRDLLALSAGDRV